MSDVSTQTIILGVSESEGSDLALRYAVDEALRQECGLTVVHVLPDSLPPPPGDPLIEAAPASGKTRHFLDRSKSADAHRLVTDVANRARAMSQDRIEVETSVPVGRHVHSLIKAAKSARLIVLQHRDLPMIERIFVRSTSVGVSGRAPCPVVIVPPTWQPETPHNRVTVGLDDLGHSEEILRVAFQAASLRMATLEVVHAWKSVSAEEDVIVSRTLEAEWQARSERTLEDLLLTWQRQFPEVQVTPHATHKGAVDALMPLAKESDLLVLGRFRPVLHFPLPLGNVARAMINKAGCPVEIVPHTRSARAGSPNTDGDHAIA